jgi:putative transposase
MPAKTHPRVAMRLKGYDYAQSGAYFVTICLQDRLCMFGEVSAGLLVPNQYGELVEQAWNDLPNHYPHVTLDQFVVMPNHIHGIIILTDVGAGFKPVPTPTDLARVDFLPAPMAIGPNPAPRKRHALPEIIRALRRSQHAESTRSANRRAPRYGNATITNTSSAVKRITPVSLSTSSTIRARWSEDSLHPENAPRVETGVIGAGRNFANRQPTPPTEGAGLKPAPTSVSAEHAARPAAGT